jgi:hypothetical protein
MSGRMTGAQILEELRAHGKLDSIFLGSLSLKLIGITLATWDPISLVDGAGETKSITVTGAALGDIVLVAPPYDMQDFVFSGYVQAANTVEIRIQNESTATVNLASGTWKVIVLRVT